MGIWIIQHVKTLLTACYFEVKVSDQMEIDISRVAMW